MIDINVVRCDTPACESVVHFNNAGASLMPQPVYDAVTNHLSLENSIGGYEAGRKAQPQLQDFYVQFARLLHAEPCEIAYVENATRAWDMAFYGLPLHAGDRILTHASEYVSNYLAMLQLAKRKNLHIDLIPSDQHGQIDVTAIPGLISDKTRLIAITHVPTQGGLVNPVAAVGKIAKAHGLIYLLDACQSAGQIELDVNDIGCDVLSGTGRKFLRGPRGTGFLYVRKGFLEKIDPPFVDLFSASWTSDNGYELAPDAKRFENWESFVGGRVGLTTAVRYALSIGIPNIEARITTLAARLRSELSDVAGVDVHDLGVTKCGIVTFTKASVSAQDMFTQLGVQGMNTSVSVLPFARLDLGPRNLRSMVRASVHYFNTDNEIDRFVDAVKTLQ